VVVSVRRPVPRSAALPAVAALTLVTACAGPPDSEASGETTAGFPLTVENCDVEVTVADRATSVVTMNQGATEVVLALGLEDRLVGTALLNNPVPPQWQAAYDSVPVLSDDYPDQETLLDVAPDLIYGSYSSAFGTEAAGDRAEWADLGVATYISPFSCGVGFEAPEVSFDSVWGEIDDIAVMLGAPEASQKLRAAQQAQLDELASSRPGEGLDVFWYDSETDTPYVGAGEGGPQLILDAVGATNLFADQKRGWARVGWEKVVAADPDVIVLADASWSTADEKLAHLRADPVLSQLAAVRDSAFVIVPFSETTPGARLADGAARVGQELAAFTR
jgi:iron complex transport system substrate-binding protein